MTTTAKRIKAGTYIYKGIEIEQLSYQYFNQAGWRFWIWEPAQTDVSDGYCVDFICETLWQAKSEIDYQLAP